MCHCLIISSKNYDRGGRALSQQSDVMELCSDLCTLYSGTVQECEIEEIDIVSLKSSEALRIKLHFTKPLAD